MVRVPESPAGGMLGSMPRDVVKEIWTKGEARSRMGRIDHYPRQLSARYAWISDIIYALEKISGALVYLGGTDDLSHPQMF